MKVKKKKLLVIFMLVSALLGVHFQAYPETVSQKQAKQIASQFFNAANGQIMGEPKLVYNGRRLTTNNLFPPFYVYNLQAGGFVVISAENKAFPILGYDLKDNFNPDKMSETLKELLRLYALHIENIRYDSTYPYEAEKAWQNIPEYISNILDARNDITDPVTTPEVAQAELDEILDMNDSFGFASVNYSPEQWQYSIDLELEKYPDVVIGLIKKDSLLPVIIHGKKGDYYRMELNGRNRSYWRLLPTEILSNGQVAVLGNPTAKREEPEEEIPHSFYADFVRETEIAQAQAQATIENLHILNEPKVQWLGGGHFTVSLPEEVNSMRLFSLDGAQVQYEKFRDTAVASINLTGQPAGFYFAVFTGKSGEPYSIKIFR